MSTDAPPQKRKLIDIVKNYKALLQRVDEYLRLDIEHADVAHYLGLSISNYYSKRKGERRFTYHDIKQLLERFGTEEEKRQYYQFIEVRDKVYNCLVESRVPLAQYRRLIHLQHHKNLIRRRDHPDTWKVEDLEIIGQFMESIAYCID